MTYSEFLQRYQYDPVADRIGKGGFGIVFKAYDTHLDRYVAIKMSEVEDDLDSMRLAREVELAAKLPTHPNIAHYEACYTFATPTGQYDFGILQFYNEGSLNDILSKGLNKEQKTSILTQILDGIDFLHSHNVVHRDLKPRNILIARRGNEFIPKITDFGMSKEFEEGDSSRFGNSITGAGTLAYASPEQLGEKQMRRNADLWSFGIIAFQLFTGELPFNSGSHPATSSAGRIELFRQINKGELPSTIDSIPEPWQQLIRRLIVVDPEARLRTCADARKVLIGDFANPDSDTAPKTEAETTATDTPDDTTHRENPQSAWQDINDGTHRESDFIPDDTGDPDQIYTDSDYEPSEPESDDEEPDKRHSVAKKILLICLSLLALGAIIGGACYWYYDIRIDFHSEYYTDLCRMNLKGDVAYINSTTYILPDTIPYLDDDKHRYSRHYFEEFYDMDEHYLFSLYLLQQFPFTHIEFNSDGFITKQSDNHYADYRYYDDHNRIVLEQLFNIIDEFGNSESLSGEWSYNYNNKQLTQIDFRSGEKTGSYYEIHHYIPISGDIIDYTWNETNPDNDFEIVKTIHSQGSGYPSFSSDLGHSGDDYLYQIWHTYYDETGDIETLTLSYSGKVKLKWQFRYDYDTEGNWIRRYETLIESSDEYNPAGKEFLTIREIYYNSIQAGDHRIYSTPTQAPAAEKQVADSAAVSVVDNTPVYSTPTQAPASEKQVADRAVYEKEREFFDGYLVETLERRNPRIEYYDTTESTSRSARMPWETTPQKSKQTSTQPNSMPQFPGGESALLSYINTNLNIPSSFLEKGIQGTVVIGFTVSETGAVTNVHLIQSFDPDCDQEALRVIRSLPNYNPGYHNGNPVKHNFTIPITFRILS